MKYFSLILPGFGDVFDSKEGLCNTLVTVMQLPVLYFAGGSVLKELEVDSMGFQ